MNTEILKIAELLKDAYEGEPWFGKSVKQLLSETDTATVFEKINEQHSQVQLLWHMVNWRQFTISRLYADESKNAQYFTENDWQELDSKDKNLWQQGVEQLHRTQTELIAVIDRQQDQLLDQRVPEREYTYRKLLHGIVQHDIYHLGQIAFLNKLLKKQCQQ